MVYTIAYTFRIVVGGATDGPACGPGHDLDVDIKPGMRAVEAESLEGARLKLPQRFLSEQASFEF